jgi:hypothetical protein
VRNTYSRATRVLVQALKFEKIIGNLKRYKTPGIEKSQKNLLLKKGKNNLP